MARWPGLEVRLPRSLFCVLSILILLLVQAPFAGAAPTSVDALPARVTQADDTLAEAAEMARELSRLEADRDFDALYELMHPDARAVVPRSAVVGWYESFFADRGTSEISVTDAVYEPWTWAVTGATYDDAVTVRFVQPYTVNGVPEDVTGEVHLAPAGNTWGWFFGASLAFVEEQVALFGDDGSATMFALEQGSAEQAAVPRDVLFPDPLHAHVDTFWETQFTAVGRDYLPPRGIVAFDEPIVTACGRADPEQEAAFYCVIDEKIYYSTGFRFLIEQQIGDFAWVVVVAHEWGHHIQAQLGFELGVSPDLSREVAPIELEQQADCIAGAYSIDAEITGWLDPGDIDEALYMTEISGDPPGTAWDDPRAHGTSADRVDAFLRGYAGGLAACDLDLSLGTAAA